MLSIPAPQADQAALRRVGIPFDIEFRSRRKYLMGLVLLTDLARDRQILGFFADLFPPLDEKNRYNGSTS